MKKKHQIKTIDDIKYCEKHKLTIFSEIEDEYYEFQNNCWCKYDDDSGKLLYYGCGINTVSLNGFLYYYEEEKEQQEATTKDIGKLCWFYKIDDKRCYRLSVLMGIYDNSELKYMSDSDRYSHCRPLAKYEIRKFLEKAE